MSRKDKKETKKQFEKKVLKDLRRLDELRDMLYTTIVDEDTVIGKEKYLVIKKDACISEKDRKLLQEFLDNHMNIGGWRRIGWVYNKHLNMFNFSYANNFLKIPEHLRMFVRPYYLGKEIYSCSLHKYYSNFLTIAERSIYKTRWVLMPKEESEWHHLQKKLFEQKSAQKVLHMGKSEWEKIEHSYKRSENKKELYKALIEEPFFIF